MDFVTFSEIWLQAAALRKLVLPSYYELGGVQTHYRYLLRLLSANFTMHEASCNEIQV